jgi:hypothetical protein
LKPDEFWRLTLTEFNDLVKGYEWRDEQEWQRIAQLAAWTINPHIKRAITADKLLNKKKDPGKVVSLDEKRRELKELEAELSF